MTRSLRQRFDSDGEHSIYSNNNRRYSDSEQSDRSYHSYSTAPTDYGSIHTRPTVPQFGIGAPQLATFTGYTARQDSLESDNPYESSSRISIDTYASTVSSLNEVEDNIPEYEIPNHEPRLYRSTALPATPADFAELFPSRRRLTIAHDDSTADGNMNLRLDTTVETSSGRSQEITLFHLRMYDLKKREFSLRRYDRDSGREVCHSIRKYQKPASEKRPAFQRSLSNALATLRTRSDNRTPTMSTFNRSDSGYASLQSPQEEHRDHRPKSAGDVSKSHPPVPTNTTKLEFSNYAQLEIKRRGAKSSKRYEFDYWGRSYIWRRDMRTNDHGNHASYHLYSVDSDQPLAHIEPEPMSPLSLQEEHINGGWIPPCFMWISDERLCRMQDDVSEYAGPHSYP